MAGNGNHTTYLWWNLWHCSTHISDKGWENNSYTDIIAVMSMKKNHNVKNDRAFTQNWK